MAESDTAAGKMAEPDAAAGKMAESDAADGKMANGEVSDDGRAVEVSGSGDDTLPAVLRGFVDGVWPPPGDGGDPLLRRLRAATCEAAPRLRDASRNSARDLLAWTKQGSGLRAILVISVGTITMISLTGLLIFMSFLLVATANAIIVSVLMSLAAAGGFLALFFACLVAVYVGAVSIAIFVVSATVISAIVGVMIATGWIGFFWMIWFAARKSLDLTKHSIGMTTSAMQSYSASRSVGQKLTD
ncbi:unnamed protein product [Triticum turgidum subsp. durum]|uniref:Uncharacterized protein n=1 Tax=Triticum turgidum subsp. durum TaxID=4567 RepID=A0A9R0S050_TRITD|nr:unnamed protein product [Triticum turgidum subsp. durum]